MTSREPLTPASHALFTLAEIKRLIAGFDGGDASLSDTVDAIVTEIENFRAVARQRESRDAA